MDEIAGVIGVGAMGLGVVQSLRRAGIETIVRDVRPEREAAAAALGAAVAPSPAAVARAAGVTLVLVVDAAQAEDVLFGADGYASAAPPRRIVVMSSTVEPEFVVSAAERLRAHAVTLVDAPVSGGPRRAADGTMTMMVGADAVARARCAPLFACIAGRVFDAGGVGNGARMKLVNNLLAAINLAAAAEAYALGVRAGLSVRTVHEVVAASSGASWIGSDRMPRALATELTPPHAAARVLTKDVTLATDLARRCGVATPLGDAARAAFETLVREGYGEDDDAVLLARAITGTPT
jgi:3-hydroxyisobutyrate dehydrogenase